MYNQFFGFKEKPFKLVPNPEYLYLSRIHEEVLAHLNYAARHGEGFVEITGEVGTGKTTLCRMFLENLDEQTEAAYIFNPKLDALQLLKAINDEFGVPSESESIKTLIDRLNRFLLEKKVENKQVILLIDEAQNLSADVLEQLRLLSNLETSTSKLLQIILVGQPELSEILESENLRQLNQRISLNCQLTPLSYRETKEYIRHRIHIASLKPGLAFSHRAYRAIYKFSKGVPRLINIVSDRVLLTAYSREKYSITHSIVKKSVRELESHKAPYRKKGQKWEKWTVCLLAILVVLVLLSIFNQMRPGLNRNGYEKQVVAGNGGKEIATDPKTVSKETNKVPTQQIASSLHAPSEIATIPPETKVDGTNSAPEAKTPRHPMDPLVTEVDFLTSRANALKAICRQWNNREPVITETMTYLENEPFFRIAARSIEMDSLRVKGDLSTIRSLNLPTILEISLKGKTGTRFIAVLSIEGGAIWLSDNLEPFSVSPESLFESWNGTAYVLWKNFFNYKGVIPTSSPGEVIVSLKVHLKRLGFPIKEMNGAYDATTHRAIEAIQRRNGLMVDGIVGPMTKIVLYNEDRLLEIPRLTGTLDE